MAGSAPLSYSIPQRAAHWATVLLVLFNLIIESNMGRILEMTRAGQTPGDDLLGPANLHLWAGVAILVLTMLRIVLKLVQGAPEPPESEAPIFKLAAKATHGLFYLLLLLMPLLGLLAYYLGQGWAGFLHEGPLKALLWLLIIVHVGAALVHKFVWRTDVMDRMTKGV